MTKVVNIYKEEADVYVGRRRSGMHYGNPFGYVHEDGKTTRSEAIMLKLLPKGATRQDTIEAYRNWLKGIEHQEWEPQRREWILARLPDLVGQTLGCFCKPKNCHADVLAEMANATVEAKVACCVDEPEFSFPETGKYEIKCVEEMNTWWVFDNLKPYAGPFSTERKAREWLLTKDVPL